MLSAGSTRQLSPCCYFAPSPMRLPASV
jgi:hypothetical protein